MFFSSSLLPCSIAMGNFFSGAVADKITSCKSVSASHFTDPIRAQRRTSFEDSSKNLGHHLPDPRRTRYQGEPPRQFLRCQPLNPVPAMAMSCRYAAQSCARQLRSAPTARASAQFLRVSATTRRFNSTEAAATNPKIQTIVDQISQLTLLETADLVSSLKVCCWAI